VPLQSNDVYRVPMPDGAVARIRVQCGTDGSATFRAAPDKGDKDEAAALAAIEILTGYLQARGNSVRVYFRRYRDRDAGAEPFTDILDAVTARDMADGAHRLLREFQLIASSRIH
jgi:hypothetical protein